MSCERNQTKVAGCGGASGTSKTVAKTAATVGAKAAQATGSNPARQIAVELEPLAQAFEAAGFEVEEAVSEDGRPVIKLDLVGATAAGHVTLPAGWILTYPTPEARQAALQAAVQKPKLTMYKFPRSTAIESAGYHKGDQALYLKFRRGQVYRYAPVSPEDFQALMKSPSKGKFFQSQIRGRGIPFTKVEPEAFEALAGPQKPPGDEVYRQTVKDQLKNKRQILAADDFRDWVRKEGLNTRRRNARTYLARAQPGEVSAEETSRLTRLLRYGRIPPQADALLARSRSLVRRAKQLTRTTDDPRVEIARRLIRQAQRQGDKRKQLFKDYMLATRTNVKLDRQTLGLPMSPDFALTDAEAEYARQLVVDTVHFDAQISTSVPPARASLAEKMAVPPPKDGYEYTDAEWDALRQIVKDDAQNLKEEIEAGQPSVSSNVRAKRNEPIER